MLETVSLWVILPLIFISMMIIYILAHLLSGVLRGRCGEPETQETVDGFVVSGVFGLMALLMAFSFSLAIGRFEERRADVVEEANAISTMYSRLALLPTDVRTDLETDMREYTRLRVNWAEAQTRAELERRTKIADAVGDQIGNKLFNYLGSGPQDTRVPTLVGAYNAMSDIAATRHAVRLAKLPGGVLFLLAVFVFGSAAVLGFTMHTRKTRSIAGSSIVIALLALAFCTILDLDRPARGTFQVPQDEMIRQLAKMDG